MIQQTNNKASRFRENHDSDISFLKDFFKKQGRFPLFQQVLIETRTDCNNHCPFCPHAYNNKPLGIMSIECYKNIINQLIEIGFSGRVALMLSNEPLLDNRLAEMIMYAKSKSQRLFLDITTNGRLLTVEKIDYLFSIGLDNININDYRGDRDLYPNKWSSYLEPIVKAYGNNPKVDLKHRRLDERLPNYAGNIPQSFDKKDFGFCNYPFRKITIAYDGSVLLCCDDFMYDTCFGNVMTDSLVDCWNNPDLNRIRLALLDNYRINICERCNDSQDYNTFTL
jgi:MoaA/NifB/PqqE/SkfB family radical SAM enzyme